MNDAVELLNDSQRPASRRSKDGATRALDLSHPPREKLSLRGGDFFSMERARVSNAREALVRVGCLSRSEANAE
jgi:hypothetical protein